MNASIESIERLGHKVQLLIKQQDGLLRDLEKVQRDVEQKTIEIEALAEKNRQLEEHLTILRSTTPQIDATGKKAMEKKINQYIKDIDRVIAHLQS